MGGYHQYFSAMGKKCPPTLPICCKQGRYTPLHRGWNHAPIKSWEVHTEAHKYQGEAHTDSQATYQQDTRCQEAQESKVWLTNYGESHSNGWNRGSQQEYGHLSSRVEGERHEETIKRTGPQVQARHQRYNIQQKTNYLQDMGKTSPETGMTHSKLRPLRPWKPLRSIISLRPLSPLRPLLPLNWWNFACMIYKTKYCYFPP